MLNAPALPRRRGGADDGSNVRLHVKTGPKRRTRRHRHDDTPADAMSLLFCSNAPLPAIPALHTPDLEM